ncbi:hypothetical protein ACP4OV_007059 [Aristida adscensionis]
MAAQLPRAAAAAVAFDVDLLDVDDSDLLSDWFPSPCPPPSGLSRGAGAAVPRPADPPRASGHNRIPGPASAVQEAMRVRPAAGSPAAARADARAPDADFLLHPWRSALQLLGKDGAWEPPGIKVIRGDRTLCRAPLVVGVVTSCAPSGLGDLLLTLKDPTGTIGASVNKKVLSQENIGQDISMGCAMVLKKVAVFRPSRTSCYLNITKGTLVQVFRKDCNLPPEQKNSLRTESQLHVEHTEIGRNACLGEDYMECSAGTSTSEETSIFNRMIPRPKDNLSPMYKKVEAEVSDNITLRLSGGQRMPSSKDMTVAGVSHGHHRTPVTGSRSSIIDKCVSNINTDEDLHKIFSQQGVGESSAMSRDGYCTTEATAKQELRRPIANEWMLPSGKKLKSDAALPHANGASTSTNAVMDAETKPALENNVNMVVDDKVEQFHATQASIGEVNKHQEKDIDVAYATPMGGSLLPILNTKKVSMASISGWTDEQLSELDL